MIAAAFIVPRKGGLYRRLKLCPDSAVALCDSLTDVNPSIISAALKQPPRGDGHASSAALAASRMLAPQIPARSRGWRATDAERPPTKGRRAASSHRLSVGAHLSAAAFGPSMSSPTTERIQRIRQKSTESMAAIASAGTHLVPQGTNRTSGT